MPDDEVVADYPVLVAQRSLSRWCAVSAVLLLVLGVVLDPDPLLGVVIVLVAMAVAVLVALPGGWWVARLGVRQWEAAPTAASVAPGDQDARAERTGRRTGLLLLAVLATLSLLQALVLGLLDLPRQTPVTPAIAALFAVTYWRGAGGLHRWQERTGQALYARLGARRVVWNRADAGGQLARVAADDPARPHALQ